MVLEGTGSDVEGGIMTKVGKFEKVSFKQFQEGMGKYPQMADQVEEMYRNITLPVRSTRGSAGYDFRTPFAFTLAPGETILIPTGIRCRMLEDWMLAIFPRSGLGFKFRLQLNNTVGIIDSDYYGSDNEGHIFIRMTNDSNEGKTVDLKAGDAFAQGIFLPYGITEDDAAEGVRNGGFGSTG